MIKYLTEGWNEHVWEVVELAADELPKLPSGFMDASEVVEVFFKYFPPDAQNSRTRLFMAEVHDQWVARIEQFERDNYKETK